MLNVMTRRRLGIALLIGVALSVGGGIAYAAIPGSDGTISGCAEKRTGILRVIDAEAGKQCLSAFENPIAWNARGPQGLKGDKGDAGAVGPSEAWFRASNTVTFDNSIKEIVSVELPEGLYAVTATGDVKAPGPTACELLGTAVDANSFGTDTDHGWQALSLSGVATITNPRPIRVECISSSSGVQVEANILAIKVGALK